MLNDDAHYSNRWERELRIGGYTFQRLGRVQHTRATVL